MFVTASDDANSSGSTSSGVIRPVTFKPQAGSVSLAPAKFQPSPNPWKSPGANSDSDGL